MRDLNAVGLKSAAESKRGTKMVEQGITYTGDFTNMIAWGTRE